MKINSNIVRLKMLEKGFNVKEMAKRTDLAYATISRVLNSPNEYSYKTIAKISKVLNCSPADIIRNENDRAD